MTNDVTPDYVVLTDGAKSLATLTGNNSPAGEPLFIPSKAETNTNKYEFSGYWVVYAPDDMAIHKTKYSVADFETIIPTRDLKLAPEFTKLPRAYTIKFYDHTRLEENVNTVSDYTYNQIISSNLKTPTFLHREFTD